MQEYGNQIIIKANSESPDFPFKIKFGKVAHINILPKPKPSYPTNNLRMEKLNQYNNELPDVFRLESMKHSKDLYNNPYLNEVIPVDRKELYKNIERSRKNIKYIDKLKYNIRLSQDPKMLSRIKHEYANLNKSNSQSALISPLQLSKFELSKENGDDYTNKVFSLYKHNSPKIGFRLRNQIDSSKNLKINDSISYSPKDKEKLSKLKSIIDVQHSAYLGNINNYDIKENYTENKNCKFEFERKKMLLYDPITNQERYVQPDVITNDKWDKYSESFALLKGNLKRKGGYFSEFATKNRAVFDIIKRPLKKLKEDEDKENIKEKRLPLSLSYSTPQNNDQKFKHCNIISDL